MLPDNSLHAGWHSTDEESVPVRSESLAKTPGLPVDNLSGQKDITRSAQHITPTQDFPGKRSMRLSAVTGITIVLIGVGLYYGFINLKGSVTDTGTSVTVSITTDGQFDPAQVTLHAGDNLTITNVNKDPQVLKTMTDKDLFPVQVIMETPFVFTVPSGAEGTYTYVSETLPDDRTLTITVEPSKESSGSDTAEFSSSSSSELTAADIPLPFGSGPVVQASSSSSEAAVASSAPAVAASDQNKETVSISLSGGGAGSSSSEPALDSSKIPTNPYTVGTKSSQPQVSEQLAQNLENTEQLHSGAPIRELRNHTPTKVTSTGPEGSLLLFIPALMGVAMLFRRLTVSA